MLIKVGATSCVDGDPKDCATGYVAEVPGKEFIVLVFRGTETWSNWMTNLRIAKLGINGDTGVFPHGNMMHKGFWQAWTKVQAGIFGALTNWYDNHPNNINWPIKIVGHSLGGALATVAAPMVRVAWRRTKPAYAAIDVGLWTYGAPRVGNSVFANFVTAQGGNSRVTHGKDPVPMVPPRAFNYRHIGFEVYINTGPKKQPSKTNMLWFDDGDDPGGNAGRSPGGPAWHGWYFLKVSACFKC